MDSPGVLLVSLIGAAIFFGVIAISLLKARVWHGLIGFFIFPLAIYAASPESRQAELGVGAPPLRRAQLGQAGEGRAALPSDRRTERFQGADGARRLDRGGTRRRSRAAGSVGRAAPGSK